jgi:uncharacterized phage protein gp47/JayE
VIEMIDLSLKTFSKILTDMMSYVSVELNKRDGSLIKTSLSAAAWAIEGIYLELANIQKQGFALFATGKYLDYKAAEAGLTRKPATPAVRYARFNIAPPIGSRFQISGIAENVYYYLSEAATNSPDAEYPDTPYIGQVTCEQPGTIGNDYTGNLICVDFLAGLTSAKLLNIAIAGENQETDDSLRARYVAAVSQPEFAGNIAAYRSFLLAQSGVGAVQVYPTWDGAGTVLCSVVDSEYLPISQEQITVLQKLVCPPEAGQEDPSANGYGMAPIGAAVMITTATSVNVSVTADVKIKASSQRTIGEIQTDAESIISEYILSLCSEWGTMGAFNYATYSITIYLNRVLGMINNIDGVEVANNVKINGNSIDLVLTEEGEIGGQEIPVFSGVTLTQI